MIRTMMIPFLAVLLIVTGCAGAVERRGDIGGLPDTGVLKQVKLWYTEYQAERTIRTRVGDIAVYRDYTIQVRTVRPSLEPIIIGCYKRLIAEGSVTYRYETMENRTVVTRVAQVTRDDPGYVTGLLQNLEKDINRLKEQENLDPGQKVVLEYY